MFLGRPVKALFAMFLILRAMPWASLDRAVGTMLVAVLALMLFEFLSFEIIGATPALVWVDCERHRPTPPKLLRALGGYHRASLTKYQAQRPCL